MGQCSSEAEFEIRRISRQDLDRASGAARVLARTAREAGLELGHLWGGFDAGGHLRQVVLLVPQSGRTAMMFHTPPLGREGASQLAGVIQAAARNLPRSLATLVQALPDPLEIPTLQALQQAGFWKLADLDYLTLTLEHHPPAPPTPWPARTDLLPWDENRRHDFLKAMDLSYQKTLDCPLLRNLRTTDDTLASHMSCGRFDPDLWRLLKIEGRPAGLLLMNRLHDEQTAELVYLGLAPEFRGRGLARLLLSDGLTRLLQQGLRRVILAVDCANHPAVHLYRDAGFRATDRRVAMIRPAD